MNLQKVVLDTDILSYGFKGKLPGGFEARLASFTVNMSFATRAELHKWTVFRGWGPERRARLDEWCDGIALLSCDRKVLAVWGELQARADRRGRPRPQNDTWIAACCLVEGLPLATFNRKDFQDFAVYDGPRLFDVT